MAFSKLSGNLMADSLRLEHSVPSAAVGSAHQTRTEKDMAGVAPVGVYSTAAPDREYMRSTMYQTIAFLGFLSQMSVPPVRSAFLRGRFGLSPHSERMLQSLDKILELMLPFPPLTDESERSEEVMAAVDFFDKMTSKDSGEPLDRSGSRLPVCMTFGDWFGYLGTLSRSHYWKELSMASDSDQQVEPLFRGVGRPIGDKAVKLTGHCTVDSFANHSGGGDLHTNRCSDSFEKREKLHGQKKTELKKEHYLSLRKTAENNHRRSPSDSPQRPRTKLHSDEDKRRNRVPKARNSGPRACSTRRFSETSLSDSSLSSDEAEPLRRERQCRRDDRPGDLYHVLENLRSPRDVVEPDVFDGAEGQSMRQFFEEYNEYFSMKYNGSEKQKAKLFEKFLSGHVLQAYDAVGGSEMRFEPLKTKLLRWYKSERPSPRYQTEVNFEKAGMHQDDTLHIYAMRLKRLADKAFPDSGREFERQLCRKFMNTVPRGFHNSILDAERNFGLLGGYKKLKWRDMLKLAESEDRQRRNRRHEESVRVKEEVTGASVWFSRPNTATNSGNKPEMMGSPAVNNGGYQGAAKPKRGVSVYRNSSWSPSKKAGPPGSPDGKIPNCHWCGRWGHLENRCWDKAGCCRICGSSEHHKNECPRFDSAWGTFEPVCSVCNGPHIGKECQSGNLSNC